MRTIDDFTDYPGASSSNIIRWEPYLEKSIEGYLESNSILRQFCYIYRLNGTYTANLPRSHATGMAVEIVEGGEIPAARQVITTVDVKVTANGTAIELTDESKMVDWYGDLAAREVEEAAKRMLRKENNDIITTLNGAAVTTVETINSGYLDFEDILDSKTALRKTFYNPDTLLVAPDEYIDIVKDDRFLDFSQSNSLAPLREGTIGGRVAGINVVEVPEITAGTAYMVDFSASPLWLVVLQDMQVESFRIPDRRMDKVQMYCYEKPAVLKPEAIRKITLKA